MQPQHYTEYMTWYTPETEVDVQTVREELGSRAMVLVVDTQQTHSNDKDQKKGHRRKMSNSSLKQKRRAGQGASRTTIASHRKSQLRQKRRNPSPSTKAATGTKSRLRTEVENLGSGAILIRKANEYAEQEKREFYEATVTIDLFAQEHLWKK